jgi:tRNA (guanine-N7-)-methyltransferase
MTARTYRTRHRHVPPERIAALQHVLTMIGVPEHDHLDLAAMFSPPVSRVLLDVGVGGGESALLTARDTTIGVIAVEVHLPGLVHVAEEVVRERLPNVRLAPTDVLDLLTRCRPGCVDEIRLLFPDPWPKRRHSGRRLISVERLPLFARALRPGGMLYVATDAETYARHVTAVLDAGGWTREADTTTWSPRPPTRYGERAAASGRTVFDLRFTRTSTWEDT